MRILIQLFRWIYDHALGLFVSKETGEIFTRAAFIAAVLASITAVYVLYAAAVAGLSMAIPAEYNFALVFIPDNTSACMTAITTLRVGLYIAALKLGFASVGVK